MRIRTTKIKRGAKPTHLSTKQNVWNFLHKNSQETGDMFGSANLRCTNKPRVQSGLQFAFSVKVVTIWKREFYESTWRTNHNIIADLFLKHIENHPVHKIFYGMFFNLQPFYIRRVSKRDIEVCCCKLYLHPWRSNDNFHMLFEGTRTNTNTVHWVLFLPQLLHL